MAKASKQEQEPSAENRADVPAGVLKWNSRLMAAVIAVPAVAGVAGTAIAALGSLPHWYMHAVMYGVLMVYVLLYAQAHHRRRRASRAFLVFLNVLLDSFFVSSPPIAR